MWVCLSHGSVSKPVLTHDELLSRPDSWHYTWSVGVHKPTSFTGLEMLFNLRGKVLTGPQSHKQWDGVNILTKTNVWTEYGFSSGLIFVLFVVQCYFWDLNPNHCPSHHWRHPIQISPSPLAAIASRFALVPKPDCLPWLSHSSPRRYGRTSWIDSTAVHPLGKTKAGCLRTWQVFYDLKNEIKQNNFAFWGRKRLLKASINHLCFMPFLFAVQEE